MSRKYPVIQRAPERPHKCIITGATTNLIDLDKYVPGYGRVYISVNVIAGIAQAHGFLSPAESETIRQGAADAQVRLDYLINSLEGFTNGTRDALDHLLADADVLRADPVGGDVAAVDGAEVDELGVNGGSTDAGGDSGHDAGAAPDASGDDDPEGP